MTTLVKQITSKVKVYPFLHKFRTPTTYKKNSQLKNRTIISNCPFCNKRVCVCVCGGGGDTDEYQLKKNEDIINCIKNSQLKNQTIISNNLCPFCCRCVCECVCDERAAEYPVTDEYYVGKEDKEGIISR